jgi:hypothetical protein
VTNEKLLDLLREARAHLSFRSVYAAASFQYGDKATAEKQQALVDDLHARIDAALAGRDKPVEELNAEGRIWRAYRNRELTEDEARERLAALRVEEAR